MSLAGEIDSLAAQFAAHAAATGRRVAVAESCTGGLLAGALTGVAGSSEWFAGGVVAYSVDIKAALLGVKRETVARCGAVSVETALEMARGALGLMQCTTAASVTGLAGPGTAGESVPVGTVCIAWADARAGERSLCVRLDGGRAAVRGEAVRHALESLCALP